MIIRIVIELVTINKSPVFVVRSIFTSVNVNYHGIVYNGRSSLDVVSHLNNNNILSHANMNTSVLINIWKLIWK